MKLVELSDGMSNHSEDFSNDSQNSQMSTADFMASMGNGVLLTSATFITLEGLNSGVPTRTTPTLTPTTLRNIEQTFIELQSKPESHENEAGFVPPLVHSIGNNQYISASEADIFSSTKSQNMWQSSLSQSSSDSNTRSTPPLSSSQKTSPTPPPTTTTRRNMGGRKPTKDINISPEEEERRRVRRERNKAAAARCRKRRVDHTNALIQETEELEQKKQQIKDELQQLQVMKDELEYLLESHRNTANCRLQSQSPPDIKPFVQYENRTTTNNNNNTINNNNNNNSNNNNNNNNSSERVKSEHNDESTPPPPTLINDNDNFPIPSPAKRIMLSSTVPISKPSRPNSLNVGATAPKNNLSDLGVSITTPSTGMQFNFDSLMVGGTGLTPVSAPLVPSCSIQQRNLPINNGLGHHHHHHLHLNVGDLTSPDACGPPKLVSL